VVPRVPVGHYVAEDIEALRIVVSALHRLFPRLLWCGTEAAWKAALDMLMDFRAFNVSRRGMFPPFGLCLYLLGLRLFIFDQRRRWTTVYHFLPGKPNRDKKSALCRNIGNPTTFLTLMVRFL
jgi:hypothetical protein